MHVIYLFSFRASSASAAMSQSKTQMSSEQREVRQQREQRMTSSATSRFSASSSSRQQQDQQFGVIEARNIGETKLMSISDDLAAAEATSSETRMYKSQRMAAESAEAMRKDRY